MQHVPLEFFLNFVPIMSNDIALMTSDLTVYENKMEIYFTTEKQDEIYLNRCQFGNIHCGYDSS